MGFASIPVPGGADTMGFAVHSCWKRLFWEFLFIKEKLLCGQNTYTKRDKPSIPEIYLENHRRKQVVENSIIGLVPMWKGICQTYHSFFIRLKCWCISKVSHISNVMSSRAHDSFIWWGREIILQRDGTIPNYLSYRLFSRAIQFFSWHLYRFV